MTDPGTFGLIGTEHDVDIDIAHALTTTITTRLITVILNELVALPHQLRLRPRGAPHPCPRPRG